MTSLSLAGSPPSSAPGSESEAGVSRTRVTPTHQVTTSSSLVPVPVLVPVSVSIGISNQHKLAQAGRIELTFRTPIPTGRAGG